MKKILIGFIAIGLLTFVGCEKEDDTNTETTEVKTETSSDDGITETTSGEAKDPDGYKYKTVIIGEQEWFAENLKTSKYSDGTAIPNVTDGSQWENLSTGAWCHYNNDNQYDSIYGKLYNWYAVETGKLCPTGWHVPTDAEWTVLTDYLKANGHSGKEGTALRSTSGWESEYEGENGNGTDNYRWNGLPGGNRGNKGHFSDRIGYFGDWWSSSDRDSSTAWSRILRYQHDALLRDYPINKQPGLSVRCLRD